MNSRTSTSPDTGYQRDSQNRIIKTMPPLQPLQEEKRYSPTHHAHVSVFTGLFTWALRQDRLGKRANPKVKIHSRSFGPDGVQAPTHREKTRATFTNYFTFGTQKDLRPLTSDNASNVFRNRVLFLGILCGLIVYTLVWISR